jgi:hypothetical protein
MRRTTKVLLVLEVIVCFAPTLFALIWMSMVMAVPSAILLRKGEYLPWTDWVAGLPQFIGTLLGCVALLGMMCFVLGNQRLISQRTMALCCLAGFSTLSVAAVSDASLSTAALLYLWAPFLCGLHLLYLGRSYFIRANKTMEPTR